MVLDPAVAVTRARGRRTRDRRTGHRAQDQRELPRPPRRPRHRRVTFETTPAFDNDYRQLKPEHATTFKKVVRDRFAPACDAYAANPSTPLAGITAGQGRPLRRQRTGDDLVVRQPPTAAQPSSSSPSTTNCACDGDAWETTTHSRTPNTDTPSTLNHHGSRPQAGGPACLRQESQRMRRGGRPAVRRRFPRCREVEPL